MAYREGEDEEQYLARVRQSTEIAFVNDTELLLRYLGNAGHSVYRYEFAYESEMPHVHACHCFDIPFLFRNFDKWAGAPFLEGRNVDRCMKVSDAYSRDFATFIKTRQPNENRKKYDENRENVWIYGNL